MSSTPSPALVRSYVVETVSNVFQTMLQLEIQESAEQSVITPRRELVATVTFAGQVNGVVSLVFEETYARFLTGRMLGMPADELSGHDEVNDAMGELANMVAGNIKSKVSDNGSPSLLSLPSLCRGNSIQVESIQDAVKHEFLFMAGGDRFLIDLFLKGPDVAK